MSAEPQKFDDPDVVADAVAGCPRPLLLATDIDGTLAPIVESPHQARLLTGARGALDNLVAIDGVDVAVVSGRSMAELTDQFGLSRRLHIVGSHGAETDAAPSATEDERAALAGVIAELERIATHVPGTRVERKPFAGALHVRSCSPSDATKGLHRARTAFAERLDVAIHEGLQVYEVAVRPTNKAAAVLALRRRLKSSSVVFLGDDTSDETVFGDLRPPDIGVKVGPGATTARFRVASPVHVLHVITAVAARLQPHQPPS